MLLLLLACAGGEPDPCALYAQDPRVHGRCLVRLAESAPTIEDARCHQAGSAEEDCRLRWVQGHDDRPVEELLAACTTDECRFVALDWRPADLVTQVQRCKEHLGRLADPCTVHALDRFYGGRPGLEEQRVLASQLAALGWIGADQAGMAGACGIEVDCSLFGEHAPRCRDYRAMGERFRGCLAFRPDHPKPQGPG